MNPTPFTLSRTRFDAVLVDLDGTMVDTLGDFDAVLNAMLVEMALPAVPRAFIEHTVGKGSEHLIRSTLAQVGAPAERFEEAWARYQRIYLAINGEHARVYDGVIEALTVWQAAGFQLACLTNKPGAFATGLLARKGLSAFFTLTVGGDAHPRKKPDPMPLLKTCEALGVAPARTLMVGDSSNDWQAARAAGCAVVLVPYGYNHGQSVDDLGADGVCARLDQLVPLA
jgi:phosphoglycolate phosphatase